MGILAARCRNLLLSTDKPSKQETDVAEAARTPDISESTVLYDSHPGHRQGQKASPARQSGRLAFAKDGADRTAASTGSPRRPARAAGPAATGTQRLARGLGRTCRSRPASLLLGTLLPRSLQGASGWGWRHGLDRGQSQEIREWDTLLGRPEQQQVAHKPWPLSPLLWSSKSFPEGPHPILTLHPHK